MRSAASLSHLLTLGKLSLKSHRKSRRGPIGAQLFGQTFLLIYNMNLYVCFCKPQLAQMAHSVRLWLERCTGFEPRPGRMFVNGFVHTQCSKMFKALDCAKLSMVLHTMKNPHSVRVWHSPNFGFSSVAILA